MKLRLINDPVLRQVCDLVLPEELDYVKSLVPEMTTILEREEGAALAANQVGITKRFFLMKEGNGVRLVINPDILSTSVDTVAEDEGCLSIPGTFANIERSKSLTMAFFDENYQKQVISLEGMAARAVFHEIEHLDGKLYIDQLGPLRRQMTLEKHRKYIKMRSRR